MRTRRFPTRGDMGLIGTLAALSALAGPLRAQAPPVQFGMGYWEIEDLREIALAARAEAAAPGVIVGFLHRDGLMRAVATGNAQLASDRPMETKLPFYWGSVSKIYTAYTVLRLAEQGVLTLDDPLSRFIPDFPRGDEINVRHLLGHTSGLKDFYQYFYYRPDREEMIELVTREWTREELIELAGRFGHWFDPGTDWSYSNANYFLLGIVIERATGDHLHEAYRDLVFEPQDMPRTWLTKHERGPDAALPTGYMGPVDGWVHSEMFGELGSPRLLDTSSAEWGAGGLAGPIWEGLTFLNRLMEGRIIDPESLGSMTVYRATPPLGVPTDIGEGDANGYGLGLVWTRRRGYDLVGHGGLFNGHTTGFWYIRQCRLTVGFYLNRGFVGQWAVLDRVLDALDAGRISACPVR